jgi:spermidine/putrescine transport system substrate-binding protein
MKGAPEVNIPAEFVDKGQFNLGCPPDVQALYTKIWTDLLQ